MEVLAVLQLIVEELAKQIGALLEILKMPIFSGMPPPKRPRFMEGSCSNEQICEVIKALQPALYSSQRCVDNCDATQRVLLGIEALSILDKSIEDARTTIETERHRKAEYFTSRAEIQDKIRGNPMNQDYRKALESLDEDIVVEIEVGVHKITRCLQKIGLILKKIIEVTRNPPKPQPPPTGMYT